MAITTLNNLSINRSDTAAADQLWTATSATATDFQPAAAGGSMVLIKTLTSDGSDDFLSFVNGASDVVFDSTYNFYHFKWQTIHPQTDEAQFGFQVSTDAGVGYGIAACQSSERFYNKDAAPNNQNIGTGDIGTSGTTDQLTFDSHPGNDADQSQSGYMNFYNPTNTTFMKMWDGASANYTSNDYINNHYVAGIILTTSAVDAIRFYFDTGEIQAGTVSMYGIIS